MKRFYRRSVFAVLLSIAVSLQMGSIVVRGEEVISEHKATEIANNELLKRGKDINSLTIAPDKSWHPSDPKILDYFPEVAAKIQGRTFWAVHYSPKSPYTRGGGFTVFVDKEIGEVLGVIAWE